MVADKQRCGKVHPAWFWGIGTVVATQAVAHLIAFSPAGIHFTQWFVAGTPGGRWRHAYGHTGSGPPGSPWIVKWELAPVTRAR